MMVMIMAASSRMTIMRISTLSVATVVFIVPLASMTVVVVPVLSPLFVLGLWQLLSSCFEQQSPLDRIIHQRFIGSLFLLFDRKHRIVSNLACDISRHVGVLHSHKAFVSSVLLKLLVICTFDQGINSSLSQQIAFHLLRSPSLPVCRARIHPVNLGLLLWTTSRFLHLLKLLDLPLFLPFLHHLLDPLALFERVLFFFPYPLLIAHEHWVP